MKITIDTKEESHDSIRHIINLLSSILDGNVHQNSIVESNSVEKPMSQGNMFEDKPESATEQETGNSGGIFGNMFGDSSSSPPNESSSEISDEPKIEEPIIEEIKVVAKSKPVKSAKSKVVKAKHSPGKYVASKRGKYFHEPKSEWAKKIRKENRVWFQNKEEAWEQGYKAHSEVN